MLRIAVVVCALVLPQAADAALVTYYDFNSYDGNSSSVASSNGNGALTLAADGGVWPVSQLDNPTGTTVNAVGGSSAGTALSLGNAGRATGVRTLTLGFNSTGFKDLMLSYAGRASNSAYSSAHVDYSINGTDYFDGGITFDPAASGSFHLVSEDLSSLTALNNTSTAFLRLTLSGSNLNANQDLLVDNLQINALNATPEAHALTMMATAVLLFGFAAWRRRAANPQSISPS